MRSRLPWIIVLAAVFAALGLWLGAKVAQAPRGDGPKTALVYPAAREIPPFELERADGGKLANADLQGAWTLLFFGYTHCPDVCPTTLADFASALKRMGNDGKLVQLLFITVDPKRDTPELLRQYVPAFDPGFIGLRGDERTTEKVAKAFHVYAKADPPKDAGAAPSGKGSDSYTVSHSAQSFVYDREGKLRLVIGYGLPPEKIAADLKVLVRS